MLDEAQLRSAVRALSNEGLPAAPDAAEARNGFAALLRHHGLDLGDPRCWTIWHIADIDGLHDGEQRAMKCAIDLHGLAPRESEDPIGSLQRALILVERRLHPSAGMTAHLSAHAEVLASKAFAKVRDERTRRLLIASHVRGIDDPRTFRLALGIVLPAADVFRAFSRDGLGLFGLSLRLGHETAYQASFLSHLHLITTGVEIGIHELIHAGGIEGIDPVAYYGRLRDALSDRRWVDNIVPLLCRAGDQPAPHLEGPHVRRWLAVLGGLGGWTRESVGGLLSERRFAARYEDEFVTAATNAIESVGAREAAFEVCAALMLLDVVQRRGDRHAGRERGIDRVRRWVKGLRHGRAILWLDDRLAPALVGETAVAGSPIAGMTLGREPSEAIRLYVTGDMTVLRGLVEFLIVRTSAAAFDRLVPLIRGLVSISPDDWQLLGLARGGEVWLQRRVGRFLLTC